MIACDDFDGHFPGIPTDLPRIGVCLICYSPAIVHSQVDTVGNKVAAGSVGIRLEASA